jgi:hypothetical protein
MKNPLKVIMPKRAKSASEIEAEITKLSGKLADHQRRRSELLHAAEDARTAWRDLLAGDDAEIAAAKARVDQLEHDIGQAGQTIEEYQVAISGAEERFRLAAEDEKQRAAVQKLEKAAAAAAAVAPELQEALAAVSVAVKKMIAAVPSEIGIYPSALNQRPEGRIERNNEMVSIREVVGAILAEGLYHHLPDHFDIANGGRHRHVKGLMVVDNPTARAPEVFSWERRTLPPLSTAAAVEALLTSRLRTRAKALAGGDPDGNVPEVNIVEPYKAPPPPPEIEIVGLKNFKFLGGEEGFKPRFSCIMRGSKSMVRVEVAQQAIAIGAAALADSADGKACLAWRASMKSVGMGPELSEYEDIGDPLGLQAAYDAVQSGEAASDNQVDDEVTEEVARAVG